ncbi:MAG: hypothetical protein ACRD3A_08520 [Terriglobales bacterium]
MKRKLMLLFAACLLAPSAFAAGEPRCVRGGPEFKKDLWEGYSVVLGAPADQSRKGQCRAAVLAPGGKTLFETYDSEATLNPITGTDVNGDDKPDVVLETRAGRGKCCYNYYIISLADPPGLLRAISVSVPMTFEDRDGDGKVEIWTRDNAFDSVEGLSTTDSPYPMVFFRLKGTTLYNVSPAFWSEYEADIALARGQISTKDLEDMLKAEGEDSKPKPPDAKDPKAEEYLHIKGLVLQIALDYLYGGRGQQAWQTIADMWRDNDKGRIRQVILQGRTRGVLSEINRQPTQPAAPTAPPPSQ